MTTPLKRIRINVAISTEGQKTWDATVEYYDHSWDNEFLQQLVLKESSMLVAELERLYPSKEA